MIDERNMADDGIGYIDGNMNLSDESPVEAEIMEGRRVVRRMGINEFTNLVYEMTLKMLDEQLNEDDPTAAAVPAPAGASMDPNAAAGGAMPGAPITPAEDVDTQGLPGKYAAKFKEVTKKIAQKVGDNTGGAPGFNPQGPDDKKNNRVDERKKILAKRIANNVMNQLKEQFCK